MPEEIRNEVMERQERSHDDKGHKHRGHRRHGKPQESVKPGSLKYVWRSVSHNKGAVIGMILLGLIVVRIVYDALQTHSRFGYVLCCGVASMLVFQMLVNIGMCAGIMPVIGLTLPFFSYGGSSIVTMLTALGLVSGLRAQQKPSWLRVGEDM